MFHVPQPYMCGECGEETKYSPDIPHKAPVFDTGPICPKCFERFVKAHCGTLHFRGFGDTK